MKKKYEILIVGSGLGGLVSAAVLSRHGYSVCVLEKNRQYGGNLQTFTRDKKIFDTGVHYIGGLGEGEILNQYFKYLGIMDDLILHKLDDDKYDIITFDNDENEYFHAQGYKRFIQTLTERFPEEGDVILEYCNKIKEVCSKFPLYNLSHNGDGYANDVLTLNLYDYLNELTDNELLKSVFVGSNFLYAGGRNTPFYVHALAINSFIQSAWRCVNGGGQIAKLLIKKIKESGGEIYRNKEVVDFGFTNDSLTSVITKDGITVNADYIISNIDPKITLKMIGRRGLNPAYINRVNQIKNVIAAFSIYIVFKPESFKYINHNYYHFNAPSKVWTAQDYSKESWPEAYMISMGVAKDQSEWTENLTAMTYMRFDDVKEWEKTFNTVSNESDRGIAYEKFKEEKTSVFIDTLEKKFPNIRSCIQSVYSSTPLSYRDYIGNSEGTMYGYEKDSASPLNSFISPKTKLKNLLLTGQSLNMHGILGVTISGILTCSQIIGRENLLRSIEKELGVER